MFRELHAVINLTFDKLFPPASCYASRLLTLSEAHFPKFQQFPEVFLLNMKYLWLNKLHSKFKIQKLYLYMYTLNTQNLN